MSKIIQMKNDTGDKLFPVSQIKSLCDTDGNIVGELLDSFIKNIPYPIDVKELSIFQYSKTFAGTYSNVTLPHSYNAIDGQSSSYYRGTAYYKRTFIISNKGFNKYWIIVKSAGQQTKWYINNTLIVEHKGGYTPFYIDITDYVSNGDNELVIECNNAMDLNIPPVSSDFNKNGGLYDKIYLLESSNIYADVSNYGYSRAHIEQVSVSDSSATVKYKTSIINKGDNDRLIDLSFILKDSDDNIVFEKYKKQYLKVGDTSVDETVTIDNPHLWNGLDDPYRYTAELILSSGSIIVDKISIKIGLRYYSMDETDGFKLNGKECILRGVSYHQDLYGKANAVIESDIDKDFEIIKEIGCNFLRLAHYPHNSYTFDKCDELGIIVQTEIPWVNECGVNATDDYYDNIQQQMKEMIIGHYNHPSIIFWGMWNELSGSHANYPQGAIDKTKVVEWTDKLYKYSKTLDNTRYVGLADHAIQSGGTNFWNSTVLTCDYCAENIYSGWYYDLINPNYVSNRMNTVKKYKSLCALSEYGAGCNPECHSETPSSTANRGSGGGRHDEEWANYVHECYLQKIYGTMSYLIYTSAWVLFDFAVAARKEGYQNCTDGTTLTTDTSKYYINDKGIVTRDRSLKKDVFYLYKSKWNNKETTVYITSRRFTTRPSNKITIKVYSNATSLSLYQNGVLKQTLNASGEDSGVIWTFDELTFENTTDTFKVVGIDENNREVIDEVKFSTNA